MSITKEDISNLNLDVNEINEAIILLQDALKSNVFNTKNRTINSYIILNHLNNKKHNSERTTSSSSIESVPTDDSMSVNYMNIPSEIFNINNILSCSDSKYNQNLAAMRSSNENDEKNDDIDNIFNYK